MDCPTFNKKGEDNRLSNWKKWIQMRKEFHQKMFKIQKRRPSELLLNSGENTRLKREIQTLHEYAKIPQATTDRGKPSFWDFPPGSKKFPSLLSVRTKAQDYEVPEIETIGVPTRILREKDVLTSEQQGYSDWFRKDYLLKRNEELKEDLYRIEPHSPRTENLIVTGDAYEKITIDGEKEIKTELLESPEEKLVKDASGLSIFEQKNHASKALEIEGAQFTAQGSQEIKRFHVFINYEIGKDDIVRNKVELKNIGGVALRYYWYRHLPKKVLEHIIPKRLPIFGFIFKKNEDIVLPHQTNELPITFQTNQPGVYKEIWELRTSPNVFDGTVLKGEFFLVLCACADLSNFEQFKIDVTNRIEEGMKYTAIAEAIAKLWQRTENKITDSQDESCRVTEKELFEAVNAKFGPPGTLPLVYHYDEPVVKKLKGIYTDVKRNSDPPEWNYKLEDLEISINMLESRKDKDFYRFTFEQLMSNIQKTNMIKNEDREKYQNIYLILCVMFDKISEKVYYLRQKFQIPFTETYPAVTEDVLLEQENLDNNTRSQLFFPDLTAEAIIERIKLCEIDETKVYQIEALRYVPFDDIEERYRIYQKEKYGIEIEDPKVAGKKKKQETKSKKGKEKEKKDPKKKSLAKINIRKESIAKEESYTKLLSSKTEIIPEYLVGSPPDEKSIRMYHYSMYISIYYLLCETVNEIECLLEHLKLNKKISREVLRKCIELGIPTFPPPEGEKITQKEFKELLGDIDILSISTSESSFTDSGSVLSEISKSYSADDERFFKPISSILDIPEEIEMVDAQTETDGEELFPPKTRTENVQTEADDEEFDLVAQIERELSATSVQYFKKPTEDKTTQVEIHPEYLEEGLMMEE